LDARYEKVRWDGQIRDAAVVMACGVDLEGSKSALPCFTLAYRSGAVMLQHYGYLGLKSLDHY
jgi:transposase-like protein